MEFTLIKPLFGGFLLGLAALSLLFFNGRVAGVSGILGGFLSFKKRDTLWRFAFLAGLVAGGVAGASQAVAAGSDFRDSIELLRGAWARGSETREDGNNSREKGLPLDCAESLESMKNFEKRLNEAPFLTSKEHDVLVKGLRKEKFFEKMKYDAGKRRWVSAEVDLGSDDV